MENAHRELLNAFQSRLAADANDWLGVWTLFRESTLVQETVRRSAIRLSRRFGLGEDLPADVEQELWLLIGARLRKRPNLCIDFARAKRTFGGWLFTVIDRFATQAAINVRKSKKHTSIQFEIESRPQTQLSTEVMELIDSLDREHKIAVLLFVRGFTLREVAQRQNMSVSQASRVLRQALDSLRKHF